MPLARADGRAARAQVARKWDSSSEGEALDFSEQPEGTSGDSDGGGAAGAGAPTVDLTAKSRVDVDEEVEEEEEEDEEEEEEAVAGGAAGTAAAAAPGAPATGVSAPARALPLFPARRCPAQLARRFEQRSSRRGFWPDHEQCEAGFFRGVPCSCTLHPAWGRGSSGTVPYQADTATLRRCALRRARVQPGRSRGRRVGGA